MSNELLKRVFSSIVLIPSVILIIINGSVIFNLFLIICFLISLYEWHKMSKKKIYYYFGIVFLFFSFYASYRLSEFDEANFIFLFILLVCVFTDIGGYMFGKIFKGPKLTIISPNKTYTGVLGSYLLAILCLIFFFKFLFFFQFEQIISYENFIFVILISTISQIGDIVVSYFKRQSNIKDSGNIIPGHGGLLDRIDGMIFAFPFCYIILSLNLFKLF